MKRICIGMFIASTLLLTSCSKIDQNYNKYIKDVSDTQKRGRQELKLDEYTYYDMGEINFNEAYNMPDRNYLVFYSTGEGTKKEEEFRKKLEKYEKEAGSLPVYKVKLGDKELVRLEFISRRGEIHLLNDIWDNPETMDKLPYKKVK